MTLLFDILLITFITLAIVWLKHRIQNVPMRYLFKYHYDDILVIWGMAVIVVVILFFIGGIR